MDPDTALGNTGAASARRAATARQRTRLPRVWRSMRRFHLTVAALVALLAPSAARTQAAAPDEGPVCLGFAFGAWTPALDWKGAGHTVPIERAAQDRAPGGRDWAAPPVGTDTTIMLYPRWWPVGIVVTLPTRTPAVGDTIAGHAVALVPRHDVAAPEARVRAWRVACGARPPR
jgi:hypothetical protein